MILVKQTLKLSAKSLRSCAIETKRLQSHVGVEKEWRSDNKRVLLLGCGMVAEPVIEYLTRSPDVKITVASNEEEAATLMASRHRNTVPQFLDANDSRAMKQEIKNHDLVISLLPHPMHPFIAELCVDARRNMLTASYATDKMKEIAERGKAKGIMIMNEVGLDPGIDHMMAMRLFDEIKANNGTIESFTSYCGGLPAPQFTNNPLRYKFTWFPRGVLLNAGTGEAKYLQDGKTVSVAAGELMKTAKPFEILPGFNLESYPNRDSTVYLGAYGIENAHTVLRGTLRYKGYADAMQTLFETGLFAQTKMNLAGFTWKDLVKELLGSRTMSDDAVKAKLKALFNGDPIKMTTLKKLGLLDNTPIPENLSSPLDALVAKLESTLMMPDDESDVIIMNHNIGVRWPSGKCEIQRSNLVVYGKPGASAMSRTVGLPTGIAAEMMINGKNGWLFVLFDNRGEISQRGLVLPFAKSIYNPILTKLEAEGITERREVDEVD